MTPLSGGSESSRLKKSSSGVNRWSGLSWTLWRCFFSSKRFLLLVLLFFIVGYIFYWCILFNIFLFTVDGILSIRYEWNCLHRIIIWGFYVIVWIKFRSLIMLYIKKNLWWCLLKLFILLVCSSLIVIILSLFHFSFSCLWLHGRLTCKSCCL